ncbi:MAG: hypothetical protein R3F17_15210 [Planctomycetota bacterium]
MGVLYAWWRDARRVRVAAPAAGLLGLHFAPLYFEELAATALFQLLSLAGLWAVMAAWDRPAVWRVGARGATTGLAALVRSNALPAGLLWLFLVVARSARSQDLARDLAGAMAADPARRVACRVRNWRAGANGSE